MARREPPRGAPAPPLLPRIFFCFRNSRFFEKVGVDWTGKRAFYLGRRGGSRPPGEAGGGGRQPCRTASTTARAPDDSSPRRTASSTGLPKRPLRKVMKDPSAHGWSGCFHRALRRACRISGG